MCTVVVVTLAIVVVLDAGIVVDVLLVVDIVVDVSGTVDDVVLEVDVLVDDSGTVVDVVVEVEVDVLVVDSGAVVVDVMAHSERSRFADASPCGAPLNSQCVFAATACVPAPTEMLIVSVADGPVNVTSRSATSTPSIVTDSWAVAATDGKSW